MERSVAGLGVHGVEVSVNEQRRQVAVLALDTGQDAGAAVSRFGRGGSDTGRLQGFGHVLRGLPLAGPRSSFRRSPSTMHAGIATWQYRMNSKHGSSLTVDGRYGPGSDAACRGFQSGKGLSVDGVVGPATWGATFAWRRGRRAREPARRDPPGVAGLGPTAAWIRRPEGWVRHR
ncbi:peptidoglycan-binding domain-containing protein [Streptomyces hydrogenans]|uniref:peptidoglycan-binding domain-containing protein n=1 Tax=Streptomyces hydrogenans TaxID=1873719 RepID=UPI00382228C5